MDSKFYQPGAQRADKVHDLFATIARRYDLLNDLMSAGLHRHWKNRVVKLAGQPRDVLDLCCGTGDIALRFQDSRRDSPWRAPVLKVVGADFTAEMLQVAKARRDNAVKWIQADALNLPFPNESFDVVTVGYGLRNLASIPRGLSEILRVLRPGGKFISLDFGKPASGPLRRAYFAYLRSSVPLLGKLFCGDRDTHAYILASLEAYPAQRGVKDMMERTGFVNCGFDEFIGGTMAINYGNKRDS